MERIDAFPTQLWIEVTDNIDNDALAEFILNKQKTDGNVNLENLRSGSSGSWQSHTQLFDDLVKEIPDTISGLDNLIKKTVKEIILYNEYKYDVKINYKGMWANINGYKDYNKPHVHPQCDWSGVYYVKIPENCGSICFVDPRTVRHMLTQPYLYGNKQATQLVIVPAVGRLIMFPSFLEHQVDSNQSHEPRISISFNLGLF